MTWDVVAFRAGSHPPPVIASRDTIRQTPRRVAISVDEDDASRVILTGHDFLVEVGLDEEEPRTISFRARGGDGCRRIMEEVAHAFNLRLYDGMTGDLLPPEAGEEDPLAPDYRDHSTPRPPRTPTPSRRRWRLSTRDMRTIRHPAAQVPARVGGDETKEAVHRHLTAYFDGHEITRHRWHRGPIEMRVPGFEVAQVSPGPRIGLWTYVSLGCWTVAHAERQGLEFVLCAPNQDSVHVETLAMTAYYHAGLPHQRLDLGHTLSIGRPWLGRSACDHFLVSLPYPYGADIEVCRWEGGQARLLWLLPITQSERNFKVVHGLDALENRFDEAEIRFWDPRREPAV